MKQHNYRTVAWNGNYLQVTLMSIPVNGDIGREEHPDTEQFIRLDRGRGRAQMGPGKDELTFDQEVTDGWCVIVPAGSWHNVTNIGDEPMQVYTVYAPQHHTPGKVHQNKAIADTDNDDEPADWSMPGVVMVTLMSVEANTDRPSDQSGVLMSAVRHEDAPPRR